MLSTESTSRSDTPQNGPVGDRLLQLAIYGFVWLYAIYVVICSLAANVGKFDDPIPLLHGMLIQQGKTPNLDFYSFYPPLNLYLVAAFFGVFGKTVLALRVLGALLYFCLLAVAIRFFRAQFGHTGLLPPLATLLLATTIGAAIRMPPWPGIALSLIALLTFLTFQNRSRMPLWLVACAGVLTGLACLSRVNFGAYVLLAISFNLALPVIVSLRVGRPLELRALASAVAVYGVSIALTCVTIGTLFYGGQMLTAASEFIFASSRMMSIRRIHPLHIHGDLACAIAVPAAWFLFRILQDSVRVKAKAFLAAALVLISLAVAFAGRDYPLIAVTITLFEIGIVLFLHIFIRQLTRSELTMLLFYCGLLHYFLSRADADHWRFIPLGYALLLPFLVYRGQSDSDPSPSINGTGIAVLVIACFIPMVTVEYRPSHNNLRPSLSLLPNLMKRPNQSDSDRVSVPYAEAGEWRWVFQDKDEWQAVRYLREHTSSTEPIFVGMKDHSRTFWTNLRFYWLAGRPIGVRTFQLETRLTTEEPEMRKIIRDLEQNHVRWIALDYEDDGDPSFRNENYVGSPILDEYIASHFEEEVRFGFFAILRRTVD